MSGNVEDEARARLDVAQLYEDMGQMPKAIRYYLEAAQIYREGGVPARHRELCNKILRLDPSNAQAQEELNQARAASGIDGPPEPAPAAAVSDASSGSGEGAVSAAPAAPKQQAGGLPPLQLPQPQPGKVLIPTPWLFRDPRYVQSAKKQLSTPLERSQLPFDPLPKVDPQMVMIKQEQRKKAEEEAERKRRPTVDSAFAKREGSVFTTNKPASPAKTTSSAAPAAPAAPPQQTPTPGGGRAGNLDLAEAIRRRMQEKGK